MVFYIKLLRKQKTYTNLTDRHKAFLSYGPWNQELKKMFFSEGVLVTVPLKNQQLAELLLITTKYPKL